MLKSIEIYGFKSFAKKSILSFNTPISAIVGPNGSGKSNVAEAFRFVLGEQSIKSLRGKRAEDLIFNGGKDAPRANRASVKVVFDNSRRILNIDFAEVSIERVVHRDSVSEYFINGSAVRLKDIVELLSSAHIGSSGHHIISQGEADKILNANTKDRREIIEEALGLKIYQYKKEESWRKLEKTDENIKQVESLRREIAPHIKFLKKQVEKIEKTLELKNSLTGFYQEYFKRESIYLASENDFVKQAKSGPLADRARLDLELKQARETLEKSDNHDAKSTEIITLEKRIREERSAAESLTREAGRLEGEIMSLERLLKKQRDLAESADSKLIDLKTVENLARTVDLEMAGDIASFDLEKIKTVFEKIRSLFKDFINQNKITVDTSVEVETKQDISNLQFKKSDLDKNIQIHLNQERELVSVYNTLKEEIEKEKDSNRDAEKAVFRIVAEQNEINTKLASIYNREEKLKIAENNFKQELTEAGVLAGIMAVRFQETIINDENGLPITDQVIIAEDRAKQEDRRKNIERIKIRIEDAGIGSGDEVLKEYKEVTERDVFLEKELTDLIHTSESLKNLIKELDDKLVTEFKLGVNKINIQFQDFFSKMFGGGTARLNVIKEIKRKTKSDMDVDLEGGDLDDINETPEDEEAEDGIDIEVNLPKKKIKGLMMLSGGERALTSIALLFAMSQVNPPPFVILDETDAALDEANSKKYGDMIAELSKYSQLILVTHNRETMSRAGVIYGVTMGMDGISKLLSIQFEEAVAVAK